MGAKTGVISATIPKNIQAEVSSIFAAHVALNNARRILEKAKDEAMKLQGYGDKFSPRIQGVITALNFILTNIDYAKKVTQ
jgi:hypothetical protein